MKLTAPSPGVVPSGSISLGEMGNLNRYDIIGRSSSGAGAPEAIASSAAVFAGLVAADARAFAAAMGLWYPLQQSSVAVSHTGNTNETTLATIIVPAGAIGPNGRVRIRSLFGGTNSGNTKTMRHKFGGTNYFAANFTTNLSFRNETELGNRNATNSQVGNIGSAYGSGGGAPATSAVDTTAAVTILITGTLANSGETITLESYVVEVLYGA